MINKKHIAIQLFGHMRTFEYAAPYFIKNVVNANIEDGYNVDIFIHTWNELDHNTVNYRHSENNTNKALSDKEISKIKTLYKPKDILITPQLDIADEIITEKIASCPRSKKGIYNNTYTNYIPGTLRRDYEKQNKIKYDYVIQTRPDILFKTPFKINEFFKSLMENNLHTDKNAFYFAHNMFSRAKITDYRLMAGTDLIFMAVPENMDKATDLFNNFDKNFNANNFYCMESFWAEFWKKQKLQPIALDYMFERDWNVLYADLIPHIPSLLSQTKVYNKNGSYNTKIKIFNFLPILNIKRKDHHFIIKLFGIVPFLRINKNKGTIYLLNFIPILKIK